MCGQTKGKHSRRASRIQDETSMNSISISRQSALQPVDPIWRSIRDEAMDAVNRDPLLAAFLYSTILNQESLEEAVIHRIAERLAHQDIGSDLIRQTFKSMLADDKDWPTTVRVDIQAYYDRDPACDRFIMPVLYFKGFHAIQTHRLAHWLWNQGRKDFALYLQSRSSSVFQTDINPAARIGKGIFIDHATGLVVGETAVIEDDVSILHGVTLGGTGKAGGDRHPKIRRGVLIGAGAKILGNIEIGHCSKIAAGSVVLSPVPHNKTVAGVPARVVGETGCDQPSRQMDQLLPSQTMDQVVSFDI
jgi:serine O-acetyltransferase